jgi:hypothetical protein
VGREEGLHKGDDGPQSAKSGHTRGQRETVAVASVKFR